MAFLKTIRGVFKKENVDPNVPVQQQRQPSTADQELVRRATLVQVMENTIATLQQIATDWDAIPRDDQAREKYSSALDQYICEELKTGPHGCEEIVNTQQAITNKGLVGFVGMIQQYKSMIQRGVTDKRKDWIQGQYQHLDNNIVPNFLGWLKEMKVTLQEFQKAGNTKPGWVYNPRFTDENVAEFIAAIDQGVAAMSPKSLDYKACEQIVLEDQAWEAKQQQRRQSIDLNSVWETKCTADPEWIDSLFCKMGTGNPMAALVMQMRFSLPVNPNKHVLKLMYAAGLPKGVLDQYLKKIDCGRPFRWADLANIMKVVNAFLGLVDKYAQNKGVTFTQPRPYKGQQRTVDLSAQHASMCAPGGNWRDTLFCEMGYNDTAAMVIGKMKFAVPCIGSGEKRNCVDPKNNAVLKILDIIIDGASGAGTTSSLKQSVIGGVLFTTLSGIRGKITRGELLDWDDLGYLYGVTQTPGLKQILETMLGMSLPRYINTIVNPVGLDFGV